MSQIETDIQDDIERQGRRLTLKAVICPNRQIKQAEAYFRCVGELPDGGQFTINVIQQDDQGTIAWDVPSSKVLINLASLEEKIQAEMKDAVGKSLAVDCRDTYRVNQRGESFECDVVGAGTVATGRVESVLVKVNGDRNLEWQEVVIGEALAATAAPPDQANTSTTTANAASASTAAADTESADAENADDKNADDKNAGAEARP